MIAYLATPDQVDEYVALDDADPGAGYTCFGGSGGSSRTWLGGWAPGSAGSDLPPGLGLEVPPGSKVILQVHHNTMTSDPAPDITGIEFKIEDEVEKVASVMPFASPAWLGGDGMLIPAGEDDGVPMEPQDIRWGEGSAWTSSSSGNAPRFGLRWTSNWAIRSDASRR